MKAKFSPPRTLETLVELFTDVCRRNKGDNMTIRSAARLICLLAIIFTSAISVAQTDKPLSLEYLHEKQRVFLNYHHDFIGFAKSHHAEGLEFEIPNDLATIANTSHDQIEETSVLLDIYEAMACEKDRMIVKSHLITQLRDHAKEIDLDIDGINNDISYTTLPAVSQTAIKMKDDLREVRTKLDALRGSLE